MAFLSFARTASLACLFGCGSDPGPSAEDASPPDAAAATRAIISRSSASTWESESSLASSGHELLAAWTGRTTLGEWFGEGPIGYAFSADDGETWQAPGTLAFEGRETPYNVKVSGDARGGFWAVWLGRSITVHDAIVVARALPGTAAFEAPVEVTNPSAANEGYDLPAIATHRGTALAAYTVYHASCMSTEVARSDNGRDWTRTIAGRCEAAMPVRNLNAICASESSTRIWLANVAGDPSAGNLRVELRHSDDDGKSFPASSLQIVSSPGQHVACDPIACTMQGDDLWLAYGLSDDAVEPGVFPKLTSIQVLRISSAGIARFEALDDASGFAMHPNLTSDPSGAIHVVYHAGARDDDPAGQLRSTRLAAGAAAFEPSRPLDGPLLFNQQWGETGFLGDYDGLAIAGNSLAAAYAFGAGSDVHVAFQRWSTQP
ncbi:MAG TPA: hypothetical protein VFQ53_35825 [Kofleriaceae bacterium]|nr:hypothetical protein [Kofleriaceae bacterium]